MQPLPSPYVDSGFMELQKALEESIIEYYANQTDRAVPEIELKMKVCVLYVHLCANLTGGWCSDVTSTYIHMNLRNYTHQTHKFVHSDFQAVGHWLTVGFTRVSNSRELWPLCTMYR